MKTIYPLRLLALSSLITFQLLLLITPSCFSQTESNSPYTRDTLIIQRSNGYTNSWWVRITTQKNDATPRPALCFINGSGEVGTDTTKLTVYGGHYWLNNGWDGSVTLGNGKHYPIIVTIMQPAQNQPANQLNAILDTLIKYYPILKGSIHVAGLSEGSWCWGELIQYAAYSGDETAMSKIKSYVNLEGVGPATNTSGFNKTFPTGFGHWAKKYGGKFLGLEGYSDTRNVWQISENMNDSVSGSAYFSYESDGGGAHCCWNDFYNPATTDLTSTNTNINWTYAASTHPHTMGTYHAPSSIFQWMLRQGDTSLVGAAVVHTAPVVSVGDDPTITLPVSSVSLSGSVSDPGATTLTYAWTKVSGPTQYTISNPAIINPTVSNLVAGSYVFRLTVTDNFGLSGYNDVPVVVNPALNAIPGKIEAETYTTFSGVQTQTTTDTGGGLNVGWIDQGDWMDYTVNVTSAATYAASFRVATPYTGGAFQVRSASGTVLATVTVPNTGSFQIWQTVSALVTLPAGTQTLQIISTGTTQWNINWMDFETPLLAAIPGKIEAESYISMSGVGTETTSDAGGGLDVGWIDSGDWMKYNVNVAAAGTYTATFEVAAPATGGSFQLRLADGSVLSTVTVPNTGGFQHWQAISATVTLPAGAQTLQIVSTSTQKWNINWMQFATGTAATQTTAPAVSQTVSADTPDSAALSASSFTFYPVPCTDHFIVQINNGFTGPMSVKIVNLVGQTVKLMNYAKDEPYIQATIPVSNLPAGIYLVQVQIGSQWSIVKKLIKR
ncbi:MAG TPA: carbohydrate-binding protein [Puia sp.]|nr:carbohydrate-binding protein [Puia sp.]